MSDAGPMGLLFTMIFKTQTFQWADWSSGNTPAFQAGGRGSIPVSRRTLGIFRESVFSPAHPTPTTQVEYKMVWDGCCGICAVAFKCGGTIKDAVGSTVPLQTEQNTSPVHTHTQTPQKLLLTSTNCPRHGCNRNRDVKQLKTNNMFHMNKNQVKITAKYICQHFGQIGQKINAY